MKDSGSWKKWSFRVVRGVLLVWMGLGLVVFLAQDRMLFHPRPLAGASSLHLDRTALPLSVDHEDGQLKGWIVNPDREALILYFGGNAEEVSSGYELWESIPDYSVCLVNYRGYGASDGRPGEPQMCADALRLYDLLKESRQDKKVIAMGRSMGSGVAVFLASRRPVDAVVLITPYDSLRSVAQARYPFLPIRLLMRHPMDSLARARGLQSPALFLVAGKDEVIPPHHARNLFEHWEGPREWVLLEDSGHNDLDWDPRYEAALQSFLSRKLPPFH